MAQPTSHILHISDLHFGRFHSFDRQPQPLAGSRPSLLSAIVRDAKSAGIAPDLVVVSGDLTSTADRREFTEAHGFLEALRKEFSLSMEDFVVVPGNHDVFWGDTPDRASHGEYESFAGRFYNAAPQNTAIRTVRKGDVFIAGISSVGIESKQAGGIGFIGDGLLNALEERFRDEAQDTRYRLLVLHHHLLPVSWCEPPPEGKSPSLVLDARRLLAWAQRQNVSAILHGHQHQFFASMNYLLSEPGGPLLVLGAPSAGGTHLPPNGRNGYLWLHAAHAGMTISVRDIDEAFRAHPGETFDLARQPTGAISSANTAGSAGND